MKAVMHLASLEAHSILSTNNLWKLSFRCLFVLLHDKYCKQTGGKYILEEVSHRRRDLVVLFYLVSMCVPSFLRNYREFLYLHLINPGPKVNTMVSADLDTRDIGNRVFAEKCKLISDGGF